MTDPKRNSHVDTEERSLSRGPATTPRRDPHSDAALIDEADDLPTPSQGGTSGGRIEREIGALDEEATASGADPQPTSVHKGMKPRGGDEPNLPNRAKTREPQSKAPPKRTP